MKVLSIGNSFSQDAHRYIHSIAKHEGVDIQTLNLHIGGCSLETHHKHITEDNTIYEKEINGQPTGGLISIKDALLSDEWDYITLQQASSLSFDYSSYNPYLKELFNYVKKYRPNAKILLHQTWAYEDGSDLLFNTAHYDTAEEMYSAAKKAYYKCLEDLPFDGIIPSGDAMIESVRLGIGKIHRDTFHASFGAGRYMIGLVWYKYLTNNDITNNTFADLDEPISDEHRKIVITAANKAL